MTTDGNSFQVWWVNQGHTFARAKDDGFLWAPVPVEGGQSFPHWESMTLVKPGDLVINYGHKAIVAMSIARSSAVSHANRKKEGRRVDVEVYDLPEPITFEDIKPCLDEITATIDTNKPFDDFQGIQQGYLFNFSHEGLEILTRRFGDRFPLAVTNYLGLGTEMSFARYCNENGLHFDAGLIERYVLSLKTRPFVILSGSPGTGKTSLAQRYARYLDERARKLEKTKHEGDFLSRRWFKLSFNDKTIVNAFEGTGKKINLVRRTILKDGIMSLVGLDSKKDIDMNQKKMMKDLQEGDVIIAYQGGYTVGGIGVVTQSHFVDDSGDAYDSFYESTKNFIRMDWQYKGPLKINDFFLDDNRIPAFSMWGDTIHQLNDEQIARFAEYLAGKDIRIDARGIEQRAMTSAVVSVGYGWRDLSDLLGVYDATMDDYRSTPALSVIINACDAMKRGRDTVFFLILDGMNASPPDHYLTEFLSAMESGEPLTLHTSNEVEQYLGIPRQLVLPSNLCVVGTLHAGIAPGPSMVDRAQVIDLAEPSGASYAMQHRGLNRFPMEPSLLPLLRMGPMAQSHIFEKMAGVRVIEDEHRQFHDLMAEEFDLLQRLMSSLGVPFGYRTIHDMMMYLYLAWDAARRPVLWNAWSHTMDIQILQKLLPMIRGTGAGLEIPLTAFLGCCFFEVNDPRRQDFARLENLEILSTLNPDGARYAQSARAITRMLATLNREGRVSFFSGAAGCP
jgi:DNA polymerase III delta prime subunit